MAVYRVDVRAQAASEARHAELWYESREPGLGDRFTTALGRAFDRLRENPDVGLVCLRRRSGADVRRILLHRFPFAVFYTVIGHNVEVVAIAHAKRRPGYWKKRRLQ